MSSKERCILCERNSNVESVSGRDAIFVRCETCGKYQLGEPSESVRYYREEVQREKKAMLSAYTRERFEQGGEPPMLGYPHALEGIIAEYENKSDNEKLENLIWYIKKESSQFGDSVPLDAVKDYPITYSLSHEGFTEVLNNAIEQNLVEPIESDFKLTEQGWRRGTELMEERGGGQHNEQT